MRPEVINVRGTNGSGKSTLVRAVMALYPETHPAYAVGRRQPLKYLLDAEGLRPLTVLGHYETACGGCDTLKSPAQAIELCLGDLRAGRSVLMEGIMLNDAIPSLVNMAKSWPLRLLQLDTPLEECLSRVGARRQARGNNKPLDPKNTINRYNTGQRQLERLRGAGLDVQVGDHTALLALARGWVYGEELAA